MEDRLEKQTHQLYYYRHYNRNMYVSFETRIARHLSSREPLWACGLCLHSSPAHWVCLLLCKFCTQSALWPTNNLSFFVDFTFCVLPLYAGILQNCVLTCPVLILKISRFVCELNLLFQWWKPKFSIISLRKRYFKFIASKTWYIQDTCKIMLVNI